MCRSSVPVASHLTFKSIVHGALGLVLTVLSACSPRAAPTATLALATPDRVEPTAAPTITSTPAPTATPRLPVGVGTALPQASTVLSADNVDKLIELGRWGRGTIEDVTYSPDAKFIALASASGIVMVAADTLAEVRSIDSESPAHSVAFSADGKRLVAGLQDGSANVWDATSGELQKALTGPDAAIRSISISPEGSLVAGGSENGTVSLWQLPDGSLKNTFTSHTQPITAVAFAPDGQSLFSGSEDGSVHQLQLPDGKLLHAFGGYADSGIALSGDGSLLAAAGSEKYRTDKAQVRVWTVADGKLLKTLDAPEATDVALSPDGQLVAVGKNDHTASVWNVASGESVATLVDLKPEEEAPVGWFHVAFASNGGAVAMGGLDVIATWNAQDYKLVERAKTHSFPIYGLAVSPDASLLASVGYIDVQLQKLPDGEDVPLPDDVTAFVDAAFSPDGKSLALGGQDGKVRVWPLGSMSNPQVLEALKGDKIWALTFSPDGKTLAFTAGTEPVYNSTLWGYVSSGEIQLHNIADGTMTQELTGSATWYVTGLEYSAAGDLLAAVAPGDRIRVFQASDGAPLYLFANGISLAFSPDGKRLAGATSNKVVRIWDMSSGKEVVTTKDFAEYVWPIAFSPDGELLAGGDEAGTVYIWNAEDGTLIKSWPAHSSYVNDLTFMHDGRVLVTGSGDGTIRFWGLKP